MVTRITYVTNQSVIVHVIGISTKYVCVLMCVHVTIVMGLCNSEYGENNYMRHAITRWDIFRFPGAENKTIAIVLMS